MLLAVSIVAVAFISNLNHIMVDSEHRRGAAGGPFGQALALATIREQQAAIATFKPAGAGELDQRSVEGLVILSWDTDRGLETWVRHHLKQTLPMGWRAGLTVASWPASVTSILNPSVELRNELPEGSWKYIRSGTRKHHYKQIKANHLSRDSSICGYTAHGPGLRSTRSPSHM